MVLNGTVNALLGLVVVVTFCFCSGASRGSFDRLLDPAVSPHAELPFFGAYFSATGSHGGTTAMVCTMMLINFVALMSVVMATLRQL